MLMNKLNLAGIYFKNEPNNNPKIRRLKCREILAKVHRLHQQQKYIYIYQTPLVWKNMKDNTNTEQNITGLRLRIILLRRQVS